MEYVYRYMHPDYPYLYVGIAKDLSNRIASHDNNETDNIDRKYLPLLHESIVLYIEVATKHRAKYIESYLIDKYKPVANKAEKTDSICEFEISNIKWKKYVRKIDLLDNPYENAIKSMEDAMDKMDKALFQTKTKIKVKQNEIDYEKRKLLSSKKTVEYTKDNTEAVKQVINNSLKIKNSDIELFYKEFPDSEITFFSEFETNYGQHHKIVRAKNVLTYYIDGIMSQETAINLTCANIYMLAVGDILGWLVDSAIYFQLMKNYYFKEHQDALDKYDFFSKNTLDHHIKAHDYNHFVNSNNESVLINRNDEWECYCLDIFNDNDDNRIWNNPTDKKYKTHIDYINKQIAKDDWECDRLKEIKKYANDCKEKANELDNIINARKESVN